METINRWIVLLTLALALFLINTLYQHKSRVDILQNQVVTLTTLYQNTRDTIQERELDLKECQRSYDDVLLELNLVSDSLANCRRAPLPNIVRKTKGVTKLVNHIIE